MFIDRQRINELTLVPSPPYLRHVPHVPPPAEGLPSQHACAGDFGRAAIRQAVERAAEITQNSPPAAGRIDFLPFEERQDSLAQPICPAEKALGNDDPQGCQEIFMGMDEEQMHVLHCIGCLGVRRVEDPSMDRGSIELPTNPEARQELARIRNGQLDSMMPLYAADLL